MHPVGPTSDERAAESGARTRRGAHTRFGVGATVMPQGRRDGPAGVDREAQIPGP